MRSTLTRTAGLVGAVGLLSACGGSGKPVTAEHARSVFRANGLVLHVVVDTRTLNKRQIDRLTRTTSSDLGVTRAAKRAQRLSLERVRARGVTHPLTWLTTRSDTVAVMVFGRTSDAKSELAQVERG